jgi:hypothetical protein
MANSKSVFKNKKLFGLLESYRKVLSTLARKNTRPFADISYKMVILKRLE